MTQDPQNPYAPPVAGDAAWTPKTPFGEPPPVLPSAPKVFGILSIIFGSLMLLGGLFGACGGLAGRSLSGLRHLGLKEQMVSELMEVAGTLYTAIAIQSVAFAAMSGLLLGIGIGQVRYRSWACRWSVYWGGLALLVLLGTMLLSVFVVGPAYAKMLQVMTRAAPTGLGFGASLGSLFSGTSIVMSLIFYAPYPILLLYFFTRDHIRASMTA